MPDAKQKATDTRTEATELVAMIKAYAIQETLGPLKQIGRTLAIGSATAVLFGIAAVLSLVGLRRRVDLGALLVDPRCGGSSHRRGCFCRPAKPTIGEAVSERVSLNDIESKMREVGGSAQSTVGATVSAPPVVAGGAVAGALVLAAIYLLGRRRGRKEAPVLEIRRI